MKSVGFWSAYHRSKHPREVEELTDYVQRPVAYVLARLAMPTPLTPNGITLLSMAFSLAAGVVWFSPLPHHALLGGVLLFTAAIFDAADGQLARMRGTESIHGRMLDGVADGVSAAAAIAGASWLLWTKYAHDMRLGILFVVAALVTAYAGSTHTSMYDHYKNVWLGITQERLKEGEDYATAMRRYRSADWTPIMHVIWRLYLGYVRSQELFVRRFDPHTTPSVNLLPPYDPAHAEIYRRHTAKVQRYWQFYGFGTVIIGIAVFAAFEALEIYLALRLLVLHPLFHFYVRPLQQRASREAFAEMGITINSEVAHGSTLSSEQP